MSELPCKFRVAIWLEIFLFFREFVLGLAFGIFID